MTFLLPYTDAYLFVMAVWLLAGCFSLWLMVKRWWGSHQSPKRRRELQIGLSVWVLLAALTTVELYFAIFYDTTDSFNMTNVSRKWYQRHADPQMKWLDIGNGEGIRYRDEGQFPKSVGAGRQRICFFGDSFTFGHGVAQTSDRFSNLVGAALQKKDPGRFVVTNLSQAGMDTHYVELQLIKLFDAGFEIDTVIYVICLNDIETFHPRHRTYYKDFGKRIGAPSFFLFRDTYFFNLMYYRVRALSSPEYRDYYSFVREYYDGQPWQAMQSKLDDIQQLCRSHQAELRIVIFPFLHNLGPDYPFRNAHKQIVDHCQDTQIPVIDLEPRLTPHRAAGLTVGALDAHPNEYAHRLAAAAILELWEE